MKIRTRYAPSPTGYFHIGGARTALYNYLFAKHHQGEFIVRIEDTDTERNVKDGDLNQLDNLKWLNIIPDESPLNPGEYGPYYQTKKLQRYESLANKLIEQNKAYYCFCSKETLEQQRKLAELNHETPKYNRHCLHLSKQEIEENLKNNVEHVIRLKINEHENYQWKDLIRGDISINGSALTDPVILKSNKIAMYNFAVVVDDYDMKITHVLRGEEHIANTPYQIAIKQALGFNDQKIEYGHLSIITNQEGKKISKRDTSLKQFISDYRELGYLNKSITNFLALLGWAPRDNKEIMDLLEMIEKFNLNDVNHAPAQFDETKLQWIANTHFKELDNEKYLAFVKPFVNSENKVYLSHKDEVLLLLKSQISYAKQINDLIEDLFSIKDDITHEASLELKNLLEPINKIIPLIENKIMSETISDEQVAKQLIDYVKSQTNLKGKELFMSIRIICSLQAHGPELAKLIYLLGNDIIKNNITILKKVLND